MQIAVQFSQRKLIWTNFSIFWPRCDKFVTPPLVRLNSIHQRENFSLKFKSEGLPLQPRKQLIS